MAHLVFYAAENNIKAQFYNYLVLLNDGMGNLPTPIQVSRLTILSQLLMAKKEQETTILAMIINKFGASDGKVASNAVLLIQKFIEKFPSSLYLVVREVERMISRNSVDSNKDSNIIRLRKAQYTGLVFFSEIMFDSRRSMDFICARYLVQFYLSTFEWLMKRV